ncbi:MAG: toll/interleukin-1 receptor domain-containing protein, partial [Acidobacteriota bacterium]|nr:toll/interleukin-1 receptor domain-containing protein [Acidobacteriota bacterium]
MTDYRFDVFISYSSKDAWVREWLLPALEAAGLSVCIDFRDFDLGLAALINMENAVLHSQRTLAVFTPNWVKSEWTHFEALMTQTADPVGFRRSLIPIMLTDCELPPRLAMLTWADFRDSARHGEELDRLLIQLGKTDTKLSPATKKPPRIQLSKMPITPDKLFGRDQQLTMLDNAWTDDDTAIQILVAWGGVGKTALANRWITTMKQSQWHGAKRVYAWSFYSQGSGDDRQVSSDPFIDHALRWFGDPDPSEGDAWAKAQRLADRIAEQKTLLILDGLEPLQHPPGVMQGRLRDAGMKHLLRALARQMNGLCLITTRIVVEDLDGLAAGHHLEHLDTEAGSQLLAYLGVDGNDEERAEAVTEYGGHALALTLLGRYLKSAHHGDLRRRDKIPNLEDEDLKGEHAFKVMRAYETWLHDTPELELLFLMGLFDRPVESGAIDALLGDTELKLGLMGKLRRLFGSVSNPLLEFTKGLRRLNQSEWQATITHLRDLGLLSAQDWPEGSLDAHPLVREHFGARLEQNHPETFQAAHERLYHYYRQQPKKEQPDTLAEMEPLFRAVTHGCRAGKHQESAEEVYLKRMLRGEESYLNHQLGAYGADLAAVANFFQTPWTTPSPGLTAADQALVLNWAGFGLRALGRLREATQPLAACTELYLSQKNWKFAAMNEGNLSELWLTLGDVPRAVEAATRVVDFADKSDDSFWKMVARTQLANARHQAAETERAAALFAEVDTLAQERGNAYLSSTPAFFYNDLLVDQNKLGSAKERAEYSLGVSKRNNWLLDMSLDQLILGRAAHAAWRTGEGTPEEAATLLDDALTALRKANSMHHVPRGHLARAAFNIDRGYLKAAEADLNGARHIAERGEMKLHLTDIALA